MLTFPSQAGASFSNGAGRQQVDGDATMDDDAPSAPVGSQHGQPLPPSSLLALQPPPVIDSRTQYYIDMTAHQLRQSFQDSMSTLTSTLVDQLVGRFVPTPIPTPAPRPGNRRTDMEDDDDGDDDRVEEALSDEPAKRRRPRRQLAPGEQEKVDFFHVRLSKSFAFRHE